MNCTRIGNWGADDFTTKQPRIVLFLKQTKNYIETVVQTSPRFQNTFRSFQKDFRTLYVEGMTKPKDTDVWAEKMMTWGNILTHRTALLD